jgi:hypothetical protein
MDVSVLRRAWWGVGPDDRNSVRGAVRHLRRLPVAVWALAVLGFLVLDVAVVVGAAAWRTSQLQDLRPVYEAVHAHMAPVYEVLGFGSYPAEPWDYSWDTWAMTLQVLAATSAFALLLGAAVVLAARRYVVLAVIGALLPAVSVAIGSGLLAAAAPMIPAPSVPSDVVPSWDGYPLGMQQAMAAESAAYPWTDVPQWWSVLLGAVVGLIALGAVAVVLRRTDALPRISGRPLPFWPSICALVLSAGAVTLVGVDVWTPDGRLPAFAVVTAATACVLAAAGASSRWWASAALSVGTLAVHGLLYTAFNREGGVPGSWGLDDLGLYASTVSVVVLAVAPVAGWLLASAWAGLHRRTAHEVPRGLVPA